MQISEIFNSNKPAFSFEFFPPKTEKGSRSLFNTIEKLEPLEPAYVSVTYGAGGSTRELTQELVCEIKERTPIEVVSHLTCVNAEKEEIHRLLDSYSRSGIENIMALRGDPPAGSSNQDLHKSDFPFAKDLVTFIKKHFPHFGIGVAGFPEGHPATPNRLHEMDYLREKVDAGADYICTQLFFDNRDYYDFVDRCRRQGIDVPIVAGIMPVTSLNGLGKMAELAAGARFPAPLLRALDRVQDSEEDIQSVGRHWAAQQVIDLMDNDVDGIHFYTLNKSQAAVHVFESLGLKRSRAGAA